MAPQITAAAHEPNAVVPRPVGQPPTRAYVTFLARGGDDVNGVVGLVKGLRKVKSKYPLVVAVLRDVPEEDRQILVKQGCIVREIEPLYPPESQTQFAMGYPVINYSKLRIWEFVEYSKMIYLSGDIQVYDNIDHLFDKPDGQFYAVMDCWCERTLSHTPQDRICYCPQRADPVPRPKAEISPCPAPNFNAGMFVFEPSLLTYNKLLEDLNVTTPTPFAEQDFLNMYFRDIYQHIHPIYNLVLPMLWRHREKIGLNDVRATRLQRTGTEGSRESLIKKLDKVKVVQYCVPGSKPWIYNKNEENMDREEIRILEDKWWEIYENVSLDYENCAAPVAGGGAGEPAADLEAFSEAGVGDYNRGPPAA